MSPLISISGGLPFPITLSTNSRPRLTTSFASLTPPQSPPPQPRSKSNQLDNNTFNYTITNPNGSNPSLQFVKSTESDIEKVIFDFRFLALLAVGGSLAGSLLCFLNGCVYIVDAYKVYWTGCSKGVHTGKMVLRLVEAIDVYLAGTVMLIFAMGLYGLFISNAPSNVSPAEDRALKGSTLFGMFAMRERPKWMKISSLDELKTKVGHVIVMILLVKMFERSKMVTITTGLDLLSYSFCIFLSSASLYILHNLHKDDHK
ncbi:uncharacterized protein [Rutidosis leptorrhynchoides]|uniref:uncharacterized protein n=1 Tax=Rutidosis leptorrhynchoides TaxID=125765 RepID=UPI003A9A1F1A